MRYLMIVLAVVFVAGCCGMKKHCKLDQDKSCCMKHHDEAAESTTTTTTTTTNVTK